MTEDLVIEVVREYETLTNLQLSDRINETRSQLRLRKEMLQPRTPEGVELHILLAELDEELRIRSHANDRNHH